MLRNTPEGKKEREKKAFDELVDSVSWGKGVIMKTSYILFVFISIIVTTLAWRSKSSDGSGITIGERGPKRIGGDKERHKTLSLDHNGKKDEPKKEDTTPQHFNIGLIVPHTNFGKREYQRAIRQVIELPMRIQAFLCGINCLLLLFTYMYNNLPLRMVQCEILLRKYMVAFISSLSLNEPTYCRS